jgi:hypothetical protein
VTCRPLQNVLKTRDNSLFLHLFQPNHSYRKSVLAGERNELIPSCIKYEQQNNTTATLATIALHALRLRTRLILHSSLVVSVVRQMSTADCMNLPAELDRNKIVEFITRARICALCARTCVRIHILNLSSGPMDAQLLMAFVFFGRTPASGKI